MKANTCAKRITIKQFKRKAQGKIFRADFIKLDGEKRSINMRLDALDIDAVYEGKNKRRFVRGIEMPSKKVKSFRLDRLVKLKMRGQDYGVQI